MLRVAYFKLDLFGVRGKCLKACYMALADIPWVELSIVSSSKV